MKKVYKEATTLQYIIEDGWARGFDLVQTYEEVIAQGYRVTKEHIIKEWVEQDKALHQYLKTVSVPSRGLK